MSLDLVLKHLKDVSTKFYIYDRYAISHSLVLKVMRLQGEVEISNSSTIPHVMNAVQAERLTLEALEKHPLRTRDPDEASLYIVPTPIAELFAYGCRWEECRRYDQAFGALAEEDVFLKTQGHDHVLISYGWFSFNARYTTFVPALSRHYRMLENVTVASHYGPFAPLEFNASYGVGFGYLIPYETPVTKAFSIGSGLDAPFSTHKATLEKFIRSEYFVFYHTQTKTFGYGSTPYRRAPLDIADSLPRSSIGTDLDSKEWTRRIVSSKFCLVIRGNTPHSHSLFYAIRAGCIPVVVSDYYQEYAGPFKSSLEMRDFCIFISEGSFLSNTTKELHTLQNLSDEIITDKLHNLTVAQSILLPDHPESLFVQAFLKEAIAANKRIVPSITGREYVKMDHATVVISGNNLTYRYPTLFTSKQRSRQSPVLIVGVLSTASNPDARLAVRNTWAKASNVLFLVSGPWDDVEQEFHEHGDLLWVDMPEHQALTTYKTMAFFHVVETHVKHYDYVLKTNDDCYVGIQAVSRILEKYRPEYWGKCVTSKQWTTRHHTQDNYLTLQTDKDNIAYPKAYADGMGYAVSREFVRKCVIPRLANNLTCLPWDDVTTGVVAEQCGVDCQALAFSHDDDHSDGLITIKPQVKRVEDMHWLYWEEMEKQWMVDIKKQTELGNAIQ